jgi:hypothetical protein
MINSQGHLNDESLALERLARVYPLAFALGSASSFRTGPAAGGQERGRLPRPVDCEGWIDLSRGNSDPAQ